MYQSARGQIILDVSSWFNAGSWIQRCWKSKRKRCSTQSSRSCYYTWVGASDPTLELAAAWAALPVLLEAWGWHWIGATTDAAEVLSEMEWLWSSLYLLISAGASHWENLARIQWARRSGNVEPFACSSSREEYRRMHMGLEAKDAYLAWELRVCK